MNRESPKRDGYAYRHKKKEKQRERESDRERQTDRQTDREVDRGRKKTDEDGKRSERCGISRMFVSREYSGPRQDPHSN